MATELGQAYVQIMPSAKGISGEIQKQLGPESAAAGKSAGGKISGAIKGVLITAGIGKTIGTAITAGADLEQSLGGVETLFKENADTVKANANEAFRTVGVSANDYMENVTSFSASLLQSLDGDTEAAAAKANMAMIDMGDNANKMGTDMRDIQNAYQGFAKQNYTMLDNLKLGYGGTKTEMERLLADAQELSGVEYDLDNLADVYSAIHVIQEEIGITGTTALEAEETLTGSLSALKAAFSDTLGKLALGEDIGPSLANLSTTIANFLKNLLPMITNVVGQIPQVLVSVLADAGPDFISSGMKAIGDLLTGLGEALPELVPAAVDAVMMIVTTLTDNIPMLVQSGLDLIVGLAKGLINAIPVLIEQIPVLIDSILSAITESLPLIIEAGIELFTALIDAMPVIIETIVAVLPDIIDSIIETLVTLIPMIIQAGVDLLIALVQNLPAIINGVVTAIPTIVSSLVGAIVDNIPMIIQAGVELLTSLITNLPAIIIELVKAMPQIISGLVSALGKGVSEFAKIGLNLIKGLWNGIKDAGAWLWDKISGFFSGVVDKIKGFFGIGSPSKMFEDEIGHWLPAGMAVGIEDNTSVVTDAMTELGDAAVSQFNPDLSLAAVGGDYITTFNHQGTIRVEGVNSRDELVSVVDIVMSELRREARVWA